MRWAFVLPAVAAFLATLSTRLYQRSLRHASLLDVRPLAEAVALNGICLTLFFYWLAHWQLALSSLLALDAVLLFLAWGVLHFGLRIYGAHRASQRKDGPRAVIVGAGDAGLAVLKEVAFDPASPFRPVALIDDDCHKWGRTLFGVPVLGGTRDLAKIALKSRADAILVCVPSATHSQMHNILDACRRLNLPVRSLPSLRELVQLPTREKVSPRHLREPRIEYLLQRDEFRIDNYRTRGLVEGKTVLVTGAGGSIGSELARQISTARPDKLLLLDKSENSLFYINLEISERLGTGRVKPILADLSATGRAYSVLKSERPQLVFHAAAYKHVSMVEIHPEEAIRNNVIGTRNLGEAAIKFGVGSFVNISTDKAVNPRNFMGLSKKLTELCIQELAQQVSDDHLATHFSNVRFGNVAGSAGSVIRLFWDQIQRGGPIRVTDPRASRYFMAVSEAVHLILGAAE
ncbi:MAG: polysaccharide biosynthesis protein, partial [Candidatus Acidiferrales bacterium]